eukprot:6174927-Pleurochrysis_carterae.AAC.4
MPKTNITPKDVVLSFQTYRHVDSAVVLLEFAGEDGVQLKVAAQVCAQQPELFAGGVVRRQAAAMIRPSNLPFRHADPRRAR